MGKKTKDDISRYVDLLSSEIIAVLTDAIPDSAQMLTFARVHDRVRDIIRRESIWMEE
jgi:hypothetical protein